MIKASTILIVFTMFLAACQPQSAPTGVSTETPDETPSISPTSTSTLAPIQTFVPLSPSEKPMATASPAMPAPSVVGIHVQQFTSPDQLSLFMNAGANWTRFDGFHWDQIEPVEAAKPAYQWGAIDETALKDAADTGAQIIAIVLFVPDWAQKYPGVACGPFAEKSLDQFAIFMKALVSRYSQPPYNIKYWEIGNEPDVDHTLVDPHSGFGCWGDQSDPYYGGGHYAQMLKAAYGQIKLADPQSQLLVSGLLLDCDPINPPEISLNSGQYKDCASSRFLEGILKAGGGDYFDGISFHAYDYYSNRLGRYGNPNWHSSWVKTGPVLITKAGYIRSVLTAYGHPEKYLLNTEAALLCGRDGTEAQCLSNDFALTKAYYISEANAAASASGLYANVWYSLTGWRASGLVDGSLKPYPAYKADQFSAAQLKDAAFVADVTGFPGVKGYEFTRNETRLWLLWSQDGDDHTIRLSPTPGRIYDTFGGGLPIGGELTITPAPVYLEWEP
jgi:hypothetical protein